MPIDQSTARRSAEYFDVAYIAMSTNLALNALKRAVDSIAKKVDVDVSEEMAEMDRWLKDLNEEVLRLTGWSE